MKQALLLVLVLCMLSSCGVRRKLTLRGTEYDPKAAEHTAADKKGGTPQAGDDTPAPELPHTSSINSVQPELLTPQ